MFTFDEILGLTGEEKTDPTPDEFRCFASTEAIFDILFLLRSQHVRIVIIIIITSTTTTTMTVVVIIMTAAACRSKKIKAGASKSNDKMDR